MRTRALGAVMGTVLVLAVGAPAVAAPPRAPKPTPTDRTSARVAIKAWRDYFVAVVASTPEARSAVDQFVGAVAAACPNALADLDAHPPATSASDAIGTFLTEIVYDVDLAAVRPARAPLPDLSAALTGLRWSRATWSAPVKEAVDGWQQYIALDPSNLCADAQGLASATGEEAPAASQAFVAAVDRTGGDLFIALDPDLSFCSGNLFGPSLACIAGERARRDSASLARAFDRYVKEQTTLEARAKDVAHALGLDRVWAQYELSREDANATSDARNMVSAVESCYADTDDYRKCSRPKGPLSDKKTGLSWGRGPGQVRVVRATKTGYTIVAHSKSGTYFKIKRVSLFRRATRTCSRRGVGGCPANGHW
jgi:hypothetical protein